MAIAAASTCSGLKVQVCGWVDRQPRSVPSGSGGVLMFNAVGPRFLPSKRAGRRLLEKKRNDRRRLRVAATIAGNDVTSFAVAAALPICIICLEKLRQMRSEAALALGLGRDEHRTCHAEDLAKVTRSAHNELLTRHSETHARMDRVIVNTLGIDLPGTAEPCSPTTSAAIVEDVRANGAFVTFGQVQTGSYVSEVADRAGCSRVGADVLEGAGGGGNEAFTPLSQGLTRRGTANEALAIQYAGVNDSTVEKAESLGSSGMEEARLLLEELVAVDSVPVRTRENGSAFGQGSNGATVDRDGTASASASGRLEEAGPEPWQARSMLVVDYKRLLDEGRLRECMALLEDGQHQGILSVKKLNLQQFLRACHRHRDVDSACRFVKLLPRPGLSAYNSVLKVCAESGDLDRAWSVFLEAQSQGLKPDCKLYTTLLSACATTGNLEVAFKIYHDMEAADIEPNLHTYGTLISCCAKAQQVAKAFGVYSIILKKGLVPDRAIYNALITACGQAGAVQRALDVQSDMKRDNLTSNEVTMGALLHACAQAGELDQALGIFESLKLARVTPSREAFTSLLHACSASGDLEKAQEIYQEMKDCRVGLDEIVFSALMNVAGHAGELDQAFAMLDEMRQEGVQPGSITYSTLVGICSRAGLQEKAAEVFQEMLAAGIPPPASAYNALIMVHGKAGQSDAALAVWNQMSEAGVQPDQATFSTLLRTCTSTGNVDLAFQLYHQARAQGIPPFLIACKALVAMCFEKVRSGALPPDPSYLGGAGGDWNQSEKTSQELWALIALRIYRETKSAGARIPLSTFSHVLGCLKIHPSSPEWPLSPTTSTRAHFDAPVTSHPVKPLGSWGPLQGMATSLDLAGGGDGAGLYNGRAISVYEEAAAAGMVPQFSFTGAMVVDMTRLPPSAAEVCGLAMLKALKLRRTSAPDARLFNITLKVHTDEVEPLHASKVEGLKPAPIRICSKTGAAVASLLRRLKLSYKGHESAGELVLTESSLQRWLRSSNRQRGKKRVGFKAASPQDRLAKTLEEQRMAIRMGEAPPYRPELGLGLQQKRGRARRTWPSSGGRSPVGPSD